MFHFVVVFGMWLQAIGVENKEATNRFSKYMKDNREAYGVQSILFAGLFIQGLAFLLLFIHLGNWAAYHLSFPIVEDTLIHPANHSSLTFLMDGLMILSGFCLIMFRGVLGRLIQRKHIMVENVRKLKGSHGS